MANAARQAIQNATLLPEVGFPEFTTKLITDTFNAITESYFAQMGQYVKLLQAVSLTLQDFIKNTVDDVTLEEIGSFLVTLGGINNGAIDLLLGDSTSAASLNATEATALNGAVAVPAAAGAPAPVTAGPINAAKQQAIVEAIARRIAVNKYDLLQALVRQGTLRLYVDNGSIETRLTFTTYGQSVSASDVSVRTRVEANARTSGSASAGGGLPSLIGGAPKVGAQAAASLSTIAVMTANHSQRDVTGSRVQIFGRVKLNFKTDFVPLASPGT